MAHLNPSDAFDHLQARVLDGIRENFPNGVIPGKLQSLHLDKLEVKDDLHPDDLRSQYKSKMDGGTWAVPVFATLSLKDNITGHVIDSKRIRVAEIPKTTQRYSYIVNGKEWQVDNQWQLKPGVYTRRRRNGELESRINVGNKPSFDIAFDPATKQFHMEYGSNKSKLPIYPILKTMGVDDAAMKASWGEEIYNANKSARGTAGTLERFYKTTKKETAPSPEAAKEHLFETLTSSKLRPEAVAVTLGKPHDHVNGDVLKLAMEKMLRVQAGHPEDDRDSLVFKDLRGIGDFAYDSLQSAHRIIKSKVDRQVNKALGVRDIVKFDLFNEPLKNIFKDNAAARQASQINPVEMVSSAMQTTIVGTGGITSERSINDEAKFVNPSHIGFLDPINTPEGEKTGVTLRLPIGVKKVGHQPKIPLYNLKTGKDELVSPADFLQHNVALPDQVRWENGKAVAVSPKIQMAVNGNALEERKFEDATYVMRHASQLFNMTSNLIPFLGSTSGGRAGMATRQMEQAISLVHRAAPLVQVSTGSAHEGVRTFEELLGKQASHASPVDGKVVELKKDAVVVQDAEGKNHEVQIYHHFPVTDAKSLMHSTPTVTVGQSVKSGQLVADTNYAKNGTLALGTNLRVGYLPFRGYNFEDGIVISESAASKLSSEHLHKDSIEVTKDLVLNSKKFQLEHPGIYKRSQYEKLGDDGVIKVGQRVQPGDPLVAASKPFTLKDRTGLSAIRRSMSGAHTDKSMRWDSDFEGEVVSVHKTGDKVQVHVHTIEPMQVGDKMCGRYGNKGIVTMILPDKDMPHTKDGKHIEVALNPSGVPGRMNVGQVLETAAAKIAEKTGKTYLVKNFDPNTNYLDQVKKELKAHGLQDAEEVFDPLTGQALGKVLVGPQHMLKLVHQVEKKMSVRSGMSTPGSHTNEHYDANMQPTNGGGTGGQSMGVLGMYAMLAHGAKANIREMQTWKSEGPDMSQDKSGVLRHNNHNQIWASIQTGAPLPTPKPTFAFQKFTDLLRGAGVNIEKKGHDFMLSPLTDAQIKTLAPSALPKPSDALNARIDKDGEFKPRPGGLFDEKLTGGNQGKKWTRIELAEPLPNPVFAGAIQKLTGLNVKQYAAVVGGSMAVTPSGALTDVGQGLTGGHAIKSLLDKINVQTELVKAKKDLGSASKAKLDQALKKVKYLQALDTLKMTPSEAYVLHNLPVLPPILRPVSQLPNGSLNYADLNGLYKEFATINEKLKDPVLNKNLTDESKKDLRREYYHGVKALMGVGIPYDDVVQKGILHQISGASPKQGFFQETLMNRRQDMTMRSTIVPEPSLGLDEVGLPRAAALDLFKPFVVKKLVDMGGARTAFDAPAILDKKGPSVWRALEKVMEERPVIMKRDPALHKFSVQAFKPKLVNGSAIQIHPLVTGGFNADFDGDTMSVFVPISPEAVKEAHKMYPSNNLFMESTGKVVFQPTLESALGIYKLSLSKNAGTAKKYDHPGAAIEAVRKGSSHVNDVVQIPGGKTTAGRILLASVLPQAMQKDVLHNLEHDLVSGSKPEKGLDHLLTTLAKNHASEFGGVVNKLKDLGNEASFGTVRLPTLPDGHEFKFNKVTGHSSVSMDPKKAVYIPVGSHSFSLNDFNPDTAVRGKVLGEAKKKVDAIYAETKTPQIDKDRRAIILWEAADKEMRKHHEVNESKDPSNLFLMYKAGVKPGWDQYKQMVLAPMLFSDSMNKTLPTPVTRSYSEGLDVAGYWNQMPGARRGAIMKVQEVREPGYLSKQLMNSTMHLLVNDHDCGTQKGIVLPVSERDVHDRYLAQDFKHGSLHIPSGTLVTTDIVGKIRAAKKEAEIVVRSPLKCEDEKGLCQKCVGISSTGQPHEFGTNIGIISSHTLGERAIQLSLKSFHTGGVSGSGGKLLNSFARLQQLMQLPTKLPSSATLAMTNGKIEKIEKDPTGVKVWIGGEAHHVGKDVGGLALHEDLLHASKAEGYKKWNPPVVGMKVEAGDHLSDPNRTLVNPHDLYRATKSIEQVQNHLASEVYELYKNEGIKRRAVEVVVKGLSNLTKVQDGGDHPHALRGEFRSLSSVRKMNSELTKEGKRPIEHSPVLKGLNVLPQALQEDWMAKMQHEGLRKTLLEAAATNGVSSIHGLHPVPGMAFGSQFGLTDKHSKMPGFEHLKGVPDHHY